MDGLEFIRNYLESFRLLEKKRCQQEGLLSGTFILLVLVTVLVWARILLIWTPSLLVAARLGLTIVFCFSLFRLVYHNQWWAKQTEEYLALRLEKFFPSLRNHLINACQLAHQKRYPASLVERQRQQAVEVLKQYHLLQAVDRKKTIFYRRYLAVVVTLFILTAIFSPRNFLSGLRTLFLPSFAWDISVLVEPGDCCVEPGTELTIRVSWPQGESPPALEINSQPGQHFQMTAQGSRYIYQIGSVNQPFSYRIVGQDRTTRWFRVNIKEKAGITRLKVIHDYPAYTGMKRKVEEIPPGTITTFFNTRLTLQVTFTRSVGDTWLVLGNGTIYKSRGWSATKIFVFPANQSTLYQFRYYDRLLRQTITSSRERLSVSFDQIPFVSITRPGRDLVATLPATIPLEISVNDDFGLRSLVLRCHPGEGKISAADPVFFRAELNGVKNATVPAFLKLPGKDNQRVAYYAECTDNAPVPNLGRSSIFFIYPPSSAPNFLKQQSNSPREQLEQRIDLAKQQLEKFIQEQKKISEAARKLGAIRNEDQYSNLTQLVQVEQKYLEIFQKMVEDLNKLARQTQGKYTLADELVEMISHVQKAMEGLKKPDVHMVIAESHMGLELAQEITSNLERWLSEDPDRFKWDMQEPTKQASVPEAELPEELEDIIGELLEQEEQMREEIEDITSSWMDSLDKGAGWTAMDGPISNMSAKGITGNLMPNQQEVGGRSGEGRTGRSYGEMVEKTAQGKGGRKTPARLTPDNLEPGIIQDTSKDSPQGPTGGGKLSGWGQTGLRGPVQDLTFRYDLLSQKQTQIMEKAEKLSHELKILNVYNPQLEESIKAMKSFQFQLKEGRYSNLLTTKDYIIEQLRTLQQNLARQSIVRVETEKGEEKSSKDIGTAWKEKIPSGYEDTVRRYFEHLTRK